MTAQTIFLRSEQLWYRAPEERDVPLLTRWVNNPEVRSFLDSRVFPYGEIVEKEWLQTVLVKPTGPTPSGVCMLFGRHGEEEPIGSTGVFGINWIARFCEYGILIGDSKDWNQGLGTEVTKSMVRYAFRDLNLNRVTLRVNAGNPRGRRSYEKVGFIQEGTLRQSALMNGELVDIHLMAILREDWSGE
ncbi:MAG: GNAT family N-acetyltransferase [Pirellulales bacterium]|nr:GNAT family N-acetyltransferase [Pirellulales bacterium]